MMKPSDNIEAIEKLRQANRLGIHIVEHFMLLNMVFPADLIDQLRAVDMSRVPDQIRAYRSPENDLNVYSVSFVPSSFGMIPWSVYGYHALNKPAYLIDLDQESQETSARILAASEKDLFSGDLTTSKNIVHTSSIPKLRELNDCDEKRDIPLETVADGPAALARGAAMLDELARFYERAAKGEVKLEAYDPEHNLTENNELLVAMSYDHVKGIAIPIFTTIGNPFLEEAVSALNAVSIYLQHREIGIDMPVLAYDLNQAPQESLSVWITSKEEALDLAERAYNNIATMAQCGGLHRGDTEATLDANSDIGTMGLMFLKDINKILKAMDIPTYFPEDNLIQDNASGPEIPKDSRLLQGPILSQGKWGTMVRPNVMSRNEIK